ncbi:MAG TPA: hypothetical protein VFP73_08345 [Terrabacter sp.]|nr:hypothetical protein [Terrabacter sp.]
MILPVLVLPVLVLPVLVVPVLVDLGLLGPVLRPTPRRSWPGSLRASPAEDELPREVARLGGGRSRAVPWV